MAETKKNDGSQLSDFLAGVIKFPKAFANGMINVTPDPDAQMVINTFANTATIQFAELVDHVNSQAKRASKQQLADAEQFLKRSSGTTLVNDAMGLANNLASTVARIGITDIASEIKKIIRAILKMLHITLPGWVDDLLNLIDEIIKYIGSIGSNRLASVMAQRHDAYMNDLIKVEELQRASSSRQADNDDDAGSDLM